jgi:glycosyl transferase family 25
MSALSAPIQIQSAVMDSKSSESESKQQVGADIKRDFNIDMIYIIHYSPLVERKAALIKCLADNKITEYEFYEGNLRNDLDPQKVKRYYLDDRAEANRRANFTHPNFVQNPLSTAEIGVTISHLEVWQLILNRKQERCLILEDDAVLSPNFSEQFAAYMKRLPADAEMCTLHDGCKITPPTFGVPVNAADVWYRMPVPYLRNCCTYIITKAALDKLMPRIIPFCLGIDWETQYHNIEVKMVMYWAHPPIVREGSSTGSFRSSLR